MALTRPTVAQINTVVTEITDPISVLNKGATKANVDVGFVLNRDGGGNLNVAIYWNETTDSVAIAYTTSTGGVNSNIAVSSYANLVVGNLTIYGNLVPSANITYDLGSPTQRWRTGYFSANTIDLGGYALSISSTGNLLIAGVDQNGQASISNVSMKNYVDGQITAANGAITTANVGMKGYVDAVSTAWTANAYQQQALIGNLITSGYSNVNVTSYLNTQGYNLYSNVNVAAYISTYTGAITGANLNVSGNVIAANVIAANAVVNGNINATYFVGSGQYLSGLPAGYSNVNVKAYTESMGFQNFGNVNVAAYTQTQSYTNYSNVNLSAYLGGAVTIGGNLTVNGNLFVNGNVTTINANNLSINDSMIYLADDNPADLLDIGFVSSFTNPGYQHTGFVRDASDGVWKLFANVTTEPTTTIDFTNANYSSLYVGNIQTTASANIGSTLNVVGNVLGSIGTFSALTVGGFINTIGNLSTASLTAGQINTTGNVSAAVHTGGAVTVTGFINTLANISAGGNVTAANIIIAGAGQFNGPYNESSTSAGVYAGNLNLSPRVGFFNGTASQNWQIDNNFGTFRWYTPGVTRMTLDVNGNLTVNSYANIASGSVNGDSALQIVGNVSRGGAGYHDFLRVTSTASGAINPNMFFRLNGVGNLQIINSTYGGQLFELQQSGNIVLAGALSAGGGFGSAGQYLQSTGSGIQWATVSGGGGGGGANIVNGTSNVSIISLNGNIYSAVAGFKSTELGVAGLTIANNTIITATTTSTSNVTGALVVTGGIGVSGNVYHGQRAGFVWGANNVSSVYQIFNNSINSLDTVFG